MWWPMYLMLVLGIELGPSGGTYSGMASVIMKNRYPCLRYMI